VPSICHDTSPNVIREAYARGIPVVGSTYGGIPELVRLVDPRLIFQPNDSGGLARAVTVALDPSARPELQSRALAAAATFSTGRILAAMTSVYRQVLAGPSSSLPPAPEPATSATGQFGRQCDT
jgi:glycosyltransferase involved in cell wall biosynthesis